MARKKKQAGPSKKKKKSRGTRVGWTPADVKMLHRNAGAGVSALARALKRSEAAVRLKASSEGISLRREK